MSHSSQCRAGLWRGIRQKHRALYRPMSLLRLYWKNRHAHTEIQPAATMVALIANRHSTGQMVQRDWQLDAAPPIVAVEIERPRTSPYARLKTCVANYPVTTPNLSGGGQSRHPYIQQFEKKPRRLRRGLCKVEDSSRPSQGRITAAAHPDIQRGYRSNYN